MNTQQSSISGPPPGRVASIDFFRGFTMFLLAGEASRLYGHFSRSDSPVLQYLGEVFSHHEWHGLHFWDLIQPFFMFIVGVAIPFAVANRIRKGESQKKISNHALKRSFLLLFFGWSLAFISAKTVVWRFQNVLAQLSVTYLVAFLIQNKSIKFQLIFSLALLLFIDLAYRFFPVEGFNNPWVNFENLGAWVNNKIEGVEKSSTWATLNVVSTTAHTVWGVLCGKLLMSEKTPQQKIKTLIIAALICLVIGYALDIFNITPIIKKIATVSFVFVSGGYSILVLCFSYWLIDVKKKFLKGSRFFIYVGMNSIFIYLFFQVGGAGLLSKIFFPYIKLLFSWGGELTVDIVTSLAVWLGLWYLCYWLYKNRIFIKI